MAIFTNKKHTSSLYSKVSSAIKSDLMISKGGKRKQFSLNDPNDGSTVKTNLIVDEAENKFHIENYQDDASIKEILDANKVAQNEGAYKLNALKNEKGYRVARLPNIIVHQLAKRGIMTYAGKVLDKPKFFKWLNDSDNKHFRIYTGNL